MVDLSLLVPPILGAAAGGAVSWYLAPRIAERKAEKQFELQNEQKRLDWYERAATLAERTEDDWWDVMNRGEARYEIDAVDIFRSRRDELREHAARGEAVGVDSDTTEMLQSAAADLNLAVNRLDDGHELAKIEKGSLLRTLDNIKSESKERAHT